MADTPSDAHICKATDLSAPELAQARRAITLILSRHEPWPAFVIDRCWTVLAANDAAQRLLRVMLGESTAAVAFSLNELPLTGFGAIFINANPFVPLINAMILL